MRELLKTYGLSLVLMCGGCKALGPPLGGQRADPPLPPLAAAVAAEPALARVGYVELAEAADPGELPRVVEGPEPPAPRFEPLVLGEAERVAPGDDDPERLPTIAGAPIDLGTALALVAGQNPQVNFARAQTREALAQVDRASVLWVPSLRAGVSFNRHAGSLQNFVGQVGPAERTALQAGMGVGGVAAGPPTIPGLMMDFHLADAYFQPEIARRAASAATHAATAEQNDQMLAVATTYLQLTEAIQRVAVAFDTVDSAAELAKVTEDFARAGQGLRADAQRTAADLQLRENERRRAEEDAAVASARLAQLIRLDPSEPLVPLELMPAPITLVDPEREPRELVVRALQQRPELRQQRALVAEAVERIRRERLAPLIPSVLMGLSYGGFGGGMGNTVAGFDDRVDFDAAAYWEVRNLGFGERAVRSQMAARLDQARLSEIRTLDQISREVVEAHSQVRWRGEQVAAAERAVRLAQDSYDLNLQRILDAQGLPIEVLQSLDARDRARQEYVRAVAAHNEAQFRLLYALGWPAESWEASR